jgi:hypothetical protein
MVSGNSLLCVTVAKSVATPQVASAIYLKVLSPMLRLLTVVFGLLISAIWALPATSCQVPLFPVAFSLVDISQIAWSVPATALPPPPHDNESAGVNIFLVMLL